MTRTRRPSPQTIAVLLALSAEPSAWRHGYELGQEVGLKAGSLYPILIRLCDRGLLEATWEQPSEASAGRPPRHLYRLTGAGQQLVDELAPAAPTAPARTRRAPGRATGAATAGRGALGGAW